MPPNPDSILDSVKKTLGLDSSDTTFDLDITLFINAAFGPLQQVGAGPATGFLIIDNTTLWSDYTLRTDVLGMIKQYVFMKVKMAFDPPESRFGGPAIDKILEEYLWRINTAVESTILNPSHWWILDGLSDFTAAAYVGDFGFDSTVNTIYVNSILTSEGYWWNLTGLSDFPVDAIVGDFGYDSATGNVWRKAA